VTRMNLDLRLPLGLLFALLGVVLVVQGLAVGTRVLGLNVNLVWGAAMVAFGGMSVYLGRSHVPRLRSRPRRP
jgi:hypothetical protein